MSIPVEEYKEEFKNLKNNFKNYRLKHGLTQKELANILHIRTSIYRKIETGRTISFAVAVIMRFSIYSKIPCDKLFDKIPLENL